MDLPRLAQKGGSLREALFEVERLEKKMAFLVILTGTLAQLDAMTRAGSTADDMRLLRAIHAANAESIGLAAATQRDLARARKAAAMLSVQAQQEAQA